HPLCSRWIYLCGGTGPANVECREDRSEYIESYGVDQSAEQSAVRQRNGCGANRERIVGGFLQRRSHRDISRPCEVTGRHMKKKSNVTRREFIGGAAASISAPVWAQDAGSIRGFDHVALPMQNTEAMIGFYRSLGLQVAENAQAVSVYFGSNMVNFHRPAT